MAWKRLVSGIAGPVPIDSEMGALRGTGALAGCGHAAVGIFGAAARRRHGAKERIYRGRTENAYDIVVYLPVTADRGRQFDEDGGGDRVRFNKRRGDRGGSALAQRAPGCE